MYTYDLVDVEQSVIMLVGYLRVSEISSIGNTNRIGSMVRTNTTDSITHHFILTRLAACMFTIFTNSTWFAYPKCFISSLVSFHVYERPYKFVTSIFRYQYFLPINLDIKNILLLCYRLEHFVIHIDQENIYYRSSRL